LKNSSIKELSLDSIQEELVEESLQFKGHEEMKIMTWNTIIE